MFIKLHKVISSRTSSELTKWGWRSSKKHTLSCAQDVPLASNLGFIARAAMSESGQQGPACNPDVWAHFTDVNCEEHVLRANKAQTAFGSSSWGPAVAVGGAAFLLAYLIVRVITVLCFFFFYCSGFCHTLKWICHGFTSVPHPDPPSHLPLHPIPLGLPSAPGLSACLMHPTWAGDLFHPR